MRKSFAFTWLSLGMLMTTMCMPAWASTPNISTAGKFAENSIPYEGIMFLKFALIGTDGTLLWNNAEGYAPQTVEPTQAVAVNCISGSWSIDLGDTSYTGMANISLEALKVDPNGGVTLRIWESKVIDGPFSIVKDSAGNERFLSAVPFSVSSKLFDGLEQYQVVRKIDGVIAETFDGQNVTNMNGDEIKTGTVLATRIEDKYVRNDGDDTTSGTISAAGFSATGTVTGRNISATSSLSSPVASLGTASVGGGLNVGGQTMTGTLQVTGTTNIGGTTSLVDVSATGNVSFGSKLDVAGAVQLASTLNVAGLSQFNSNATFDANVFTQALDTKVLLAEGADLATIGKTTPGDIWATNFNFTGNLTANGKSVFDGSVEFGGGVDGKSTPVTNMNIDSGSIDNTPIGSQLPSTGRFTTMRTGTLQVDSSAQFDGDVAMARNLSVDQDLSVGGNASFAKDAKVTGAVQAGSLEVSGNAVITGNVSMGGGTLDNVSITNAVVENMGGSGNLSTLNVHNDTTLGGNSQAQLVVNATSAIRAPQTHHASVDDNHQQRSNVNIISGNINGTIIGATTPQKATVTDLVVTGGLNVAGGISLSSAGMENVEITSGNIDNATIGGTTPRDGTFLNLTSKQNTVLGDAATDTLLINATGLHNAPINDNSQDRSNVKIVSGNIDGTAIGATTPKSAVVTTLTVLNGFTAMANVDMNNQVMADVNVSGGNLDGVIIGASTPMDGTFKNLTVQDNAILGSSSADLITYKGSGTHEAPTNDNNQNRSNVKIVSGNIDGTAIGATTPESAIVTTLTVLNGFTAMANVDMNNQVMADVNVSGGNLDGVIIGATTPMDGTFNNLTVQDNAILGSSSTDLITYKGTGTHEAPTNDNNQQRSNVNIVSGTLNGVVIGGSDPAAATITTLNVLNGMNVQGNVEMNGKDISDVGIVGGNIDGVVIGATTSANGTFNDLTAKDNTILGEDATDTLVVNATSDFKSPTTFRGAVTMAAASDDANYARENVNINSGMIDGTMIGMSEPSDARFTDVSISGNVSLPEGSFSSNQLEMNSGKIFIGDAQNKATEQTLGGDGTIALDGTLTLSTGSSGSDEIIDDSLTASDLAADSVGVSELANDAVDTAAIQNGAVSNDKIADGHSLGKIAMTPGRIVVGSATSRANDVAMTGDVSIDQNGVTTINAGAIVTSELADNSVTSAKIVDGAIINADVADGAIDSASIENGQVLNEDLGNDSVNSAKISDGTVSGADIATDTITAADVAAEAIGASELGDNAVDTAAIQDGAVTAAKLASGIIGSGSLAADSVNSSHIIDGAVGSADLADGGVASVDIADGTVTTTDIAADTITADDLAADSVGASELADNSVDTAAIQDSVVTSGKLAGSLTVDIDGGSIDGVTIGATSAPNATVNNLTVLGTSNIPAKSLDPTDFNLAHQHIVVGDGTGQGVGVAVTGDVSMNGGDVQLGSSVVGSAELASSSVTSVKLASSAVTSSKISAGAVTSTKLASGLNIDIDSGTIDGVTIGGSARGNGSFDDLYVATATTYEHSDGTDKWSIFYDDTADSLSFWDLGTNTGLEMTTTGLDLNGLKVYGSGLATLDTDLVTKNYVDDKISDDIASATILGNWSLSSTFYYNTYKATVRNFSYINNVYYVGFDYPSIPAQAGLMRSLDGITYSYLIDVQPTTNIAHDNNGNYVCGGGDVVLVSNDYGVTWRSVALPALSDSGSTRIINDVKHLNNTFILSSTTSSAWGGGDQYTFNSVDGGNTWVGRHSNLCVSPISLSGNRVYVGMGGGSYMYSDDNGFTWTNVFSGESNSYSSIIHSSINGGTMIAVGEINIGSYVTIIGRAGEGASISRNAFLVDDRGFNYVFEFDGLIYAVRNDDYLCVSNNGYRFSPVLPLIRVTGRPYVSGKQLYVPSDSNIWVFSK
jgi:hypothetical protein